MSELLERLRPALADRYRIEKVLGSGGFAVVCLGIDLKHHREVAIKVLRPDAASLVGPGRFHREIRIAASLVHPHIMPLHDSGEADGLLYYVMPHMTGATLRERLDDGGPMEVAEAVRITAEVADGLGHAHAHGVVHRDVKPGNIFLTQHHAMVGDFGIATALADAEPGHLTAAGLPMGTPAYMSPEQVDGPDVDGRSDIYSLGCVLQEMLVGEPPFGRRPARKVITGHLTTPAPSLGEERPDVPPAVGRVLARMLAKDPVDRFESAGDVVDALSSVFHPGERRHPRPHGLRMWTNRRRGAVLATALALTALVVAVRGGRESPAFHAPPHSYAVAPIRAPNWTAEDAELAWDAADELTRQLNGWETVRAVPQVALAGPLFDLGIQEPYLTTLEDGIRLARSVGVRTLVTVGTRIRGDSARLEALVVDVTVPDPSADPPLQARGTTNDLFGLVSPLTLEIVGLGGMEADFGSLSRLSRNPEAIRQFQEGGRNLRRWRLTEAEAPLDSAIALDSMFALAHYRLALTTYWRTARDANRLTDLGPRILREIRSAERNASVLPSRDQAHIEALRAFVEGRFEEARRRYGELLESDPTDAYAWLLAGMVEYQDRGLTRVAGQGFVPRANWNTAIRAFSESVRLSPDFYLGYGHLFDIYEMLEGRGCPVFRPPDAPPLLLWERRRASEAIPFCPRVGDSVTWIAPEDRVIGDGSGRRRALADIRERTVRDLERWAAYADREPRPEEELARWALAHRSRLPATATREEVDSLALEALDHTSRALFLTGDTTPEDRIRLGALRLATGDLPGAAALTEAGLDAFRAREGPDARLPRAAANVFLAGGQPSRVLRIMVPHWIRSSRAVEVPGEGRFVPYGGGERLVGRIEVLGAAGVRGDALDESLEDLMDAWSVPEHDALEVSLLRGSALPFVGPALASNGPMRRRWLQGVDRSHVRPALEADLWEAYRLLDSDSTAARAALERGLAAVAVGTPSASTLFMYARLAQRLARHRAAVALLDDLERRPLGVSSMDRAWGLRSLALLYRAQSHEALGEASAAARDYAEFADLWKEAEPGLQPLVRTAQSKRAQAGR